jgi:hypothetical protein
VVALYSPSWPRPCRRDGTWRAQQPGYRQGERLEDTHRRRERALEPRRGRVSSRSSCSFNLATETASWRTRELLHREAARLAMHARPSAVDADQSQRFSHALAPSRWPPRWAVSLRFSALPAARRRAKGTERRVGSRAAAVQALARLAQQSSPSDLRNRRRRACRLGARDQSAARVGRGSDPTSWRRGRRRGPGARASRSGLAARGGPLRGRCRAAVGAVLCVSARYHKQEERTELAVIAEGEPDLLAAAGGVGAARRGGGGVVARSGLQMRA